MNPEEAAEVKFLPKTITCSLTPIMQIARVAANRQWGWPLQLNFEDFLDTCLYYYFKDRGIILQGYIIEEDRNGGD
jgi:hypothetical protein